MFFLYVNFDFKRFTPYKYTLKDLLEWGLSNKDSKEVVIVYSSTKRCEDFVYMCESMGYNQHMNLKNLNDFIKIVGDKGVIDFSCNGIELEVHHKYNKLCSSQENVKVLYVDKKKVVHTYKYRPIELKDEIKAIHHHKSYICDEKYFISEEDNYMHFYKPVDLERLCFINTL